ncbi:hypothetical protein Scep_024193 [Stephania cephalantha]|uniref:Gag-pol polyprotein n=1 Tax=Stephania cephalantha TaxID=152367 RepID=A0AAP0F382_9MAGN
MIPPQRREVVHTIAQPDTDATRKLIEGMVSICGYRAYVLFDSGSTVSFISGRMVSMLGLKPISVEVHLILSTAAGDRVYPNFLVERCPVEIDRVELPADFRVLEFLEFDALLGMDWLASYHAHIDCFAKTVRFEIPGRPVFLYSGSTPRAVSTRGRLATSGEMETLVSVYTIAESHEPKLAEIPATVRVFPTCFRRLTRITTTEEIDFIIELVPGTKSISIPPYRMAPRELEELRKQLARIEREGLHHTFDITMGAPALFVKKKDGTLRRVLITYN